MNHRKTDLNGEGGESALVSNEILSQASRAFDFDIHSIQFVSNSTNEVYKYIKDSRAYFLRLSPKPVEYEKTIQAEVQWVRYLAENGVRTSLPIQTIEGNMTKVCIDREPKLWGSGLFSKWGATMGAIHSLSRSFDPGDRKFIRKEWKPAEINNPYLHNGLDYEWIRLIPLFMDYRNIGSFFWWLSNWDGNEDNLSEFQKKAIIDAVHLIERDMPFDGCNFEL